jgi:hypothetical protein
MRIRKVLSDGAGGILYQSLDGEDHIFRLTPGTDHPSIAVADKRGQRLFALQVATGSLYYQLFDGNSWQLRRKNLESGEDTSLWERTETPGGALQVWGSTGLVATNGRMMVVEHVLHRVNLVNPCHQKMWWFEVISLVPTEAVPLGLNPYPEGHGTCQSVPRVLRMNSESLFWLGDTLASLNLASGDMEHLASMGQVMDLEFMDVAESGMALLWGISGDSLVVTVDGLTAQNVVSRDVLIDPMNHLLGVSVYADNLDLAEGATLTP